LRNAYLNTRQYIVANSTRRQRITDNLLWEKSFIREASSRHAVKRGVFYIGASIEEVKALSSVFTMSLDNASASHVIDIDFSAHEGLPNRTILLVGRNGTGKTRLLSSLAATVMPAPGVI
jgi:ATPase subunit of ABC transporter with duplicated ATPase domains